MKRHATTVLLFVAAIALALFVWFDRESVSEGEKKRRESNVFPAWRRDELSRVALTVNGELLVLERDAKGDATWRMTSPRAERADVQAVERLLTSLEFATVQRKASEAGLGLDAPRAAGSVTMGKLTYRIALGGASPRPEGSSYFRLDDGAPIVVSRDLASTLLAPADTYRDRTVVPYLSIELQALDVKREGGGFGLQHLEKNAFKVTGLDVLASREALDRVWGALGAMRAESFPKDANDEALLGAPRVTLTLTPRDKAKPSAELVVGGACPGHPDDVVVLRRAPTRLLACAPKTVIDALSLDPAALVQRTPFSLRADEIEEVVLERLDGERVSGNATSDRPRKIEVARKGGGFHMRAPDDRDLTEQEADAANELLSRIAQTSEGESVGRETFAGVARVRVFAGELEEEVVVGPPLENGRTRLRRLRDGAVLEVPPAVRRRLLPRATSLRPRLVLPGETRRPSRVELRCGTPQTLVDDGSGFRMTAPAGYETDGAVTGVVEALVKGHVDLWVADEDDGTFGLRESSCKAVVAFEDGNAPAIITLGKEGEGGVYGTVEGRPGIFVAPLALRQLMATIYVSRTSVRVPPSALGAVSVAVDGKPIPPMDGEAARAAASGLHASEVLAVGPGAAARARPVSLTITMRAADAGAPLVLSCGKLTAGRRVCFTSGREAAFTVEEARLEPFLGRPEVADGGVPR